MFKRIIVGTFFLAIIWPAYSANHSIDNLYDMLKNQQAEIERLKQQIKQTEEKIEITGEMISAKSNPSSMEKKTTVGGYGELHYNYLDSKNEIDLHRFVLFFAHRFNDQVHFVSELEVEHVIAGDGQNGEVEVEQAYIDYTFTDNHRFRAGLFLIPIGIINETHEPPTFYGVERNNVEKNIIPATWWEGGFGFNGQFNQGLSYDFAFVSGLDVPIEGENAFLPRKGRNKVSTARAENPAIIGRVKWTGMPGIEISGSLMYHDDITQGALSASATLFETHLAVNKGPFALRLLYAQWDIDAQEAETLGRDEQTGWYIEPSYKIMPKLGFFVRFEQYDNNAGNSTDTEIDETSVGFNLWLHEDVVLKVDYLTVEGAKDNEGFNLGVGYQF